jgi:hypothetical protein
LLYDERSGDGQKLVLKRLGATLEEEWSTRVADLGRGTAFFRLALAKEGVTALGARDTVPWLLVLDRQGKSSEEHLFAGYETMGTLIANTLTSSEWGAVGCFPAVSVAKRRMGNALLTVKAP